MSDVTADEILSFNENYDMPKQAQMAAAAAAMPKESKGMAFDFNNLFGRLQSEGFETLDPASKELLWQMKEGVQYSPEEAAKFTQSFYEKQRELSTPQAQAQTRTAQLQAEKAQSEVNDIATKKQAAVSEIGNMRSMLGELKNHPGMSSSIGAKGKEYLFGMKSEPIAGTKAADFYSQLEQVQGGTFMQAFNNLKGGGQITEQEGAKATAAIARLNPRQSEEGFNKALMDFDAVLAQAQARATKSAPSQAPAQPAAQSQAAQPQQPVIRVIRGQTFVQQPNGKFIPQ